MNITGAITVVRSAVARLVFPVLAVVLASSLFTSAQSVLGSISGTVYDSSGAVVPGATVVLHRNETSTERSVMTDGSGNYTAVNLEAGTYDITTSASGFGSNVANGVILIARQQLRYDITLKPASGAEKVEVNASEVGVIETQSAQISAALLPEQVLDLPANYRGAGSTSPINGGNGPPRSSRCMAIAPAR